MIEQYIDYDTDYGELELNLKDIMKQKNLNINKVSKMTGLKFDVVSNYYHNRIHMYYSDILAKICYVLDCDISDILIYKSQKKIKKRLIKD